MGCNILQGQHESHFLGDTLCQDSQLEFKSLCQLPRVLHTGQEQQSLKPDPPHLLVGQSWASFLACASISLSLKWA